MSQHPLGFEVVTTLSHDDAINWVTEALKTEGFGVLTKIDIAHAFQEKIGQHFRPYTILGACNPQLAHQALSSQPEIGLMLPCNVTVEATDNGSIIRIVNPEMMIAVGDLSADAEVMAVADDATQRLKRVVTLLQQSSK